MINYFPKYFSSKAISIYFIGIIICNLIFSHYFLPIIWWLFGIIEVCSFFYFSNLLSRHWKNISPKVFSSRIFKTAIIIRLLWVFFSYFFYLVMTGQPYEFGSADAMMYHDTGCWVSSLLDTGNLNVYFDSLKGRYSDMGYGMYLGIIYWIIGNSILLTRILKVFYGAFTCVLIYKLAKRNFGEEIGRLSAIFCMLMPNLILYTGLHLKETEMLLLTVWFMERSDALIRDRKFNFTNIFFPLLLSTILFFFRTILGATTLFTLFSALMFSSNKVMGMGKRTLLIVWALVASVYLVGGKISTEVEEVWNSRESNQINSMTYRTSRENGNKFAKYMTATVFAPMIFVIPFPTVVNTPGQENQQLIHGGNFVKNIMAFFVISAVIYFIRRKKWKEHVLILSFIAGYLLILANSAFAQSERFHLPVLPFLLMLAAVGVSQVNNKSKKYFNWYTLALVFIMIGWSWFKLKGRGL